MAQGCKPYRLPARALSDKAPSESRSISAGTAQPRNRAAMDKGNPKNAPHVAPISNPGRDDAGHGRTGALREAPTQAPHGRATARRLRCP